MSHDTIEQSISQLKLLGMRETLEPRLQQAQEQQLSYREFLHLLLQDELEHRAAKTLARRLAHAKFEEEKTIKSNLSCCCQKKIFLFLTSLSILFFYFLYF